MKQFLVGTKYRVDGTQWVCVDRYTNEKGETIVGFVELAELRNDLKNEDDMFVPYDEARKGGFACHEELKVRIFVENERATQCSDTDDIEDYDFDAGKSCGTIDLVAEYAKAEARADKKLRQISTQRSKSKRSKKNNNAGCVGAIIIALVALWIIGRLFG